MADQQLSAVVRAYQDLAATTMTAESPDGMVAAFAGAYGELRRLELDPRIYREYQAESLAATIVRTATAAAVAAARKGIEVARPLLRPGAADLAFDPLLAELDRMTEGKRYEMTNKSLPRLENHVDYPAMRADLLALRDMLPDVRESAYSDSGLIGATLDGRGRLLELSLDRRLYRVTDSRRLADDIGATVRAAAGLVRNRRAVIARDIAMHRERRTHG